MDKLKRTPVFEVYKEYGGKMTDFGGWELPVQFSGIKEEHEAVRTKAGLFDVSHMGEITVKGRGSLNFLQQMLTNDISLLSSGEAMYTAMCYENGGTVDDLIVYKKEGFEYLLVVNASNTEKDFNWLQSNLDDEVEISDDSQHYAQLALQGPSAEKILQSLTDNIELKDIGFFKFRDEVLIDGIPAMVSRTGYTGEDGFEIYSRSEDGPSLWRAIMEAGKEEGIKPVGLGARDTLRFEAKLPLYGQELGPDITPVEGGIGFAVKTEKSADFFGKAVLIEQKGKGAPRKIVGIEMIDRGIPRHGYKVYKDGEEIGAVTTGTQSPTLKKNVGLVLIDSQYAEMGSEVEVEIRSKRLKAKIVSTPFYKKTRK